MARALCALGLFCALGAAAGLGARVATAQAGLVFPGGSVTHEALLGRLRSEAITQVRPVGTTSVVLRVRSGELTLGAYRPAASTHPRGHLHEIAAYRVAELLGLDNVPPTVSRVVSTNELQRTLDPNFEDRWPDLRQRMTADGEGRVRGSMTYWIPEMRELGLDQPDALREWSAKLRQGSRMESSDYPLTLLRDLSNCVLFDYLIGNTDRFSGANVQGLADRSRLFIRDHNLAFFSELTPTRRDRLSAALERSQRFSRRTVQQLTGMTRASLEAALARDPLHTQATPLLVASQVDAVFARRSTLLSYVGALIDEHGADAVLVFE
ncbi:MAG: hypothetical protein IPL19_24070 [Sandaracinaceae bacterium]|nr:hypothetical protein [Sandaracinaceae bacterium]MBK8411027.1 hypothetical protein [Sandaracinaceae bacterium]MBK8587738.1 hypothetical protein [Sandaracinaceae bacterium]